MGSWEFRDPIFLAFAGLAPLVFVLASRSPATLEFSSLSLFEGEPSSWRTRLLPLPPLCLALATVALSIALAGPRTGDSSSKIRREGIAMVLVVDRSGSMQARDFVRDDRSVDRLTAVKGVLNRFLGIEGETAGRPDDLIGLVAFARYADSLAPLTLDHGNLAAILDDVAIVSERKEDGTAIGEGLALAVERLRHREAKSRVAILLSDGVSNAGDISATQAADLAASYGIKVYTIGAGRTGYAPFPVQFAGRTILRQAYVELDERTLQSIAQRTGGRYFRAEDVDALRQVYDEIDSLERSKIVEIRYMQYEEHYAAFALAGLALVALSGVGRNGLLRRLP